MLTDKMWLLQLVLVFLCAFQGSKCYKYVDLDDHCGQTVTVESDEAVMVKLSFYVSPPIDCVVKFASYERRMTVDFRNLDLKHSTNCYKESIQLFDGQTTKSSKLTSASSYCGYIYPHGVLATSGSYLTVRYVKETHHSNSQLKFIVTPFHTGTCNSDENRCGNGRCIASSIACSLYNPCGDYTGCLYAAEGLVNVGVIVGGVVAGVAVLTGIIICVVCMMRRRRLAGTVVHSENPAVQGSTVNQAPYGESSTSPPPYPDVGQNLGQYGGQYSNQITYSNTAAYTNDPSCETSSEASKPKEICN